MWDKKPWDNDQAADWFAKLMDNTQLPDRVRETLKLCEQDDPYGDNSSILRAAVYCVLQFCRVYVWPINYLDEDLGLAIKAVHKILEDESYCYSEEIIAEIEQELEELQERIKK